MPDIENNCTKSKRFELFSYIWKQNRIYLETESHIFGSRIADIIERIDYAGTLNRISLTFHNRQRKTFCAFYIKLTSFNLITKQLHVRYRQRLKETDMRVVVRRAGKQHCGFVCAHASVTFDFLSL